MSILSTILSALSGRKKYKPSEQLLFDKVIGFKGLTAGVGTSTLVQNVAVALANNSSYSIVVIDASFLTPTQDILLGVTKRASKDFIHLGTDIAEVVSRTSYSSISCVSLNQDITHMFTNEDNAEIIGRLINLLKLHFDVILVDLPNELTNLATELAIKCNTIISVADESIKCVTNLKRSVNTFATLGVPLGKLNRVVLNKVVPNVVSGTKGALREAGLEVFGEIPLSIPISVRGLAGKVVYSRSSSEKDIVAYSNLVDRLLVELFKTTPLTEKYMSGATEKSEGLVEFDDSKSVQGKTSLAKVKASEQATVSDNFSPTAEAPQVASSTTATSSTTSSVGTPKSVDEDDDDEI